MGGMTPGARLDQHHAACRHRRSLELGRERPHHVRMAPVTPGTGHARTGPTGLRDSRRLGTGRIPPTGWRHEMNKTVARSCRHVHDGQESNVPEPKLAIRVLPPLRGLGPQVSDAAPMGLLHGSRVQRCGEGSHQRPELEGTAPRPCWLKTREPRRRGCRQRGRRPPHHRRAASGAQRPRPRRHLRQHGTLGAAAQDAGYPA